MDIAARIKQYRQERELSIRKLASEAGISHSYLSQIESGERSPSFSSIQAISRALGISTVHLLDESEVINSQLENIYQFDKSLQEFILSDKSLPYIKLAELMCISKVDINLFEGLILNTIHWFVAKENGSVDVYDKNNEYLRTKIRTKL